MLLHRRLQRMVGPYVDGQLPPSRAAKVSEHLRRCAQCLNEADFISRVKSSLRRRAG